MCIKCHQMYDFRYCLVNSVGTIGSKSCIYQTFPCHPQFSMRQPCNILLLKTVELASGKRIAYPFLTYYYLSIIFSLEMFLQKPLFYSYIISGVQEKFQKITYVMFMMVKYGRNLKEMGVLFFWITLHMGL